MDILTAMANDEQRFSPFSALQAYLIHDILSLASVVAVAAIFVLTQGGGLRFEPSHGSETGALFDAVNEK